MLGERKFIPVPKTINSTRLPHLPRNSMSQQSQFFWKKGPVSTSNSQKWKQNKVNSNLRQQSGLTETEPKTTQNYTRQNTVKKTNAFLIPRLNNSSKLHIINSNHTQLPALRTSHTIHKKSVVLIGVLTVRHESGTTVLKLESFVLWFKSSSVGLKPEDKLELYLSIIFFSYDLDKTSHEWLNDST